jgi:hypothetical protein
MLSVARFKRKKRKNGTISAASDLCYFLSTLCCSLQILDIKVGVTEKQMAVMQRM